MPAPNTTELLLQQFRSIELSTKKLAPATDLEGPPDYLVPPTPNSLIDSPLPIRLEDMGKEPRSYSLAEYKPTPSLPTLPGTTTIIKS